MLKNKEGYNSNSELIILSPSKRDVSPPHFTITKKNEEDGKYVKTGESYTNVSGNLAKVDFQKKEWEGSVYTSVKLYVADHESNELYLFNLSYNFATRGLLNSILSLPSGDNVELSIWENQKGFTNISLHQGGERVSWKYSFDELPTPKEIEFKGKKMRDYDEVDAFIEKEVSEWAANVLGSKTKSDESEQEEVEVSSDDDDDVPF
jgi:hypothetical protein